MLQPVERQLAARQAGSEEGQARAEKNHQTMARQSARRFQPRQLRLLPVRSTFSCLLSRIHRVTEIALRGQAVGKGGVVNRIVSKMTLLKTSFLIVQRTSLQALWISVCDGPTII